MVALIILDGWGYHAHAHKASYTPFLNFLYDSFPHAIVPASGSAVGLLPHCVGNSQAGHTTLGAGRIIQQPITILDNAIETGTFYSHPLLHKNLSLLNPTNRIHIFCLASNASVHGMINHALSCDQFIQTQTSLCSFIHLFLDGRDTAPRAASSFLESLSLTTHRIGSLCGRFYAMDRDQHYERTRACYRMLTHPSNPPFTVWHRVLDYYYSHDITDEFIPPTLLNQDAVIKSGDGIIFMNVRPDRALQLTQCFVTPHDIPGDIVPVSLSFFITPFLYSSKVASSTTVLFPQTPLTHTLKETVSAHHKKIFTIAETEKFAHVTYFFDGRREQSFTGETRILIPSHGDKRYDRNPLMSAHTITDAIITSFSINPCDFYLINYANADMVGHTGNKKATITALSCLDQQIERLYQCIVREHNGILIITGDHGNAEFVYDTPLHHPHAGHTTNPVPVIAVVPSLIHTHRHLPVTSLADISSLILALLNNKIF